MKFKSFHQAEQYLESFIPEYGKWGELVFAHDRTKHFMKLLGDPQNKLKVIHVAGTSGKGSTAYMTSVLLHSQKMKVGMGISPHIHTLLERIQINTLPISEEMFCTYLSEISPHIEAMKNSDYAGITYFEIIVGLTYYIFFKENVDVAVMEVGLGGRYDATNTVSSKDKISVITRIGFDHMEFLGNTLKEIAGVKAGIIQKENCVIKLLQEPEVMSVFEIEATAKQAQLITVNPHTVITSKKVSLSGIEFSYKYDGITYENLHLPLVSDYQFENAALALAAFGEFMKRENHTIDSVSVRTGLTHISIPGRMELRRYKDKEVILDGAHNGQKMEAFIQSLVRLYPDETFRFLISIKKGKEYESMLKPLIHHAEHIIVTSFENANQGMGNIHSEDPEIIAQHLDSLGFTNYTVIPDLSEALHTGVSQNERLIITGSLYLIGEVFHLLEK